MSPLTELEVSSSTARVTQETPDGNEDPGSTACSHATIVQKRAELAEIVPRNSLEAIDTPCRQMSSEMSEIVRVCLDRAG